MKKKAKQVLAVVLSAALLAPLANQVMVGAGSGIYVDNAVSVSVDSMSDEREQNFNEGWKFNLGDASNAYSADYNDSAWSNVQVPHDFSIFQSFTASGEAESGFLPGGTGWYRKSFTLPSEYDGKTLVLNFDGVYKDAYVYVNGTYVGENHYGYNNFAFDITEYVSCDDTTENVIAVKAVNTIPSSRWYSGSGIYRDVTLLVTDPVHVEVNGTTITTPDIARGVGTVVAATEIKNDSDESVSVTVSNTIYEKGGAVVTEAQTTTVTVDAGGTTKAEVTSTVTSPKLWSTETPNQYTVVTELLVNGEITDTYESDFGFRWFGFNGSNGFSLNGKNMKLNGVCMHHDQGALGSACYYDALYRQLTKLKDMGVNSIRITHNPGAEIYAEICDELGLLVIEELFDGWNIAKNGNSNDFSVYFSQNLTSDNQVLFGSSALTWAEFVTQNVVRRDRNNPSVMLWSICNEVQEGASVGSDFPTIADTLISMISSEDSTRGTTIGDNLSYTNSTINQVISKIVAAGGVAGFNYGTDSNIYTTLYNSVGAGFIASETASSINSRSIYTTQNSGSDGDGKYHLTSYDTSCVSWGRTANDSMWQVITRDYVYGQYVWTGFDYIGEPTPWNGVNSGDNGRGAIPNSSYFGIVETTGFEKDTYYLYRSQWNQDETTLHLVTAWDSDNIMYSDGKTPVVVYSNAPTVKLYRNGTHIGTATRTVNTTGAGHVYYTYTVTSENSSICTATNGTSGTSLFATFNVTYANGTISAQAYDASGAEIPAAQISGKTSVSTPGTASKIVASVEGEEIAADGSSLSYITLDVKDANDVLDTTATNEITLTLSGNGEIVGVDNGDQATTKKYQQSSVLFSTTSAKIAAYAGKALVIVRSTKEAGSFTLTASAEGLAGASAKVTTTAEASTGETAIVSYRIARNIYVPVETQQSDLASNLPTTLTATYSDGTTKELDVTWSDYDASNLKKSGTFRIAGTASDSSETLELSIAIHVYGDIVCAENYSAITQPGVIPALPTTRMTWMSDGESFEAFPVVWNLDAVTADQFTVGAKVEISGTVTALNENYPVTATIRVAQGVETGSQNVATDYLHLVDDGPYSDTLSAVADGTKVDSGYSPSRWSTYGKCSSTSEYTATITMDWATAHPVNVINLYHFLQDAPCAAPSEIIFEYALSSNWDESSQSITSDNWITIGYTKTETAISVGGSNNWTTAYEYVLDETIQPVAMRFTFTCPEESFIGLNEIEVMSPTVEYSSNNVSALNGITVNGTEIAGFDSSVSEYTLDAKTLNSIAFANSSNAAVTVIPMVNNQYKILSVSEDKSQTSVYILTLEDTPDIENVTLNADTLSLGVDETTNLSVEIEMEDGSEAPSYEVSYEIVSGADCISINGNVVTGLQGGTAVVKAIVTANGTTVESNEITFEIKAGADKTKLKALIEATTDMVSDQAKYMYTDTAYQTISEARTAAMEVIKQAGVTQEEVDAAAAELAAAKAALEEESAKRKIPQPTVTVATEDGKLKITGMIPELIDEANSCKIPDHGILYIPNKRLGPKVLTVNTSGRYRVNFTGYKENGSFIYRLKPESETAVYGFVSFVRYYNREGRIVYAYSPIVKTSLAG